MRMPWEDVSPRGLRMSILQRTRPCREVTVLLANVLKLVSCRVQDLDVGGQVAIAVDFRELGKRLVSDIGDVELVIAFASLVRYNWVPDLTRPYP